LSGVAPVTKRSGKRCIVSMRQTCHMRLRGAVYHWARVAIQHDELSHRRYAELRKRGHSHGRALRGVADRCASTAVSSATGLPRRVMHTGSPAAASSTRLLRCAFASARLTFLTAFSDQLVGHL
jgi:hypothetical protein